MSRFNEMNPAASLGPVASSFMIPGEPADVVECVKQLQQKNRMDELAMEGLRDVLFM